MQHDANFVVNLNILLKKLFSVITRFVLILFLARAGDSQYEHQKLFPQVDRKIKWYYLLYYIFISSQFDFAVFK